MTSREIRKTFLNYFEKKGHRIVHSSPVVPFEDPTLLFANAGMNQFKDVFLGNGTREYKRAADTQKCIRVSGKHNDLEEVGHDTYHHTFFEMLGNWSFGDYYKAEAIEWAWDLLTGVFKLPKERLFATVYRTDDESLELWKTKTDIKHSHILKFDEKDNFWEMGETGPCGPCSEIHINLTDDYDNPEYVNAGSPKCIEIWNLVFIQYNRDENGVLHELPSKHVDTGMGFERLCAVMQNKKSNYDSDVFEPILNEISKLSGFKYEKEEDKIAMRVIADHIRTLTFAITDGAVPGNEGRSYVLRRILRRAARYGRKLNLNKPFIYQLVDIVTSNMGDVFPEILEKKDFVKKVIKAEEESFHVTLDHGIELFEKIADSLEKEGKTLISGNNVFKLYDTYGFPVDLTNVMAKERGLSIDEDEFNVLMKKQKAQGRESSKDKFAAVGMSNVDLRSFNIKNNEKSEFAGYEEYEIEAEIIGLREKDNNLLIILNKTPFYVESGGQVDDAGNLIINGISSKVIDLFKLEGQIVHVIEITPDFNKKPEIGDKVVAKIDVDRRWDIMRNHSATHILHAALRNVLGTHVHQAGSYVGPDRLRFDFTHFAKLSTEEIKKIENIVNEKIRQSIPLNHHRNMAFDKAKNMGALMFFGDKYGDKVNVVEFGDTSMEFCGGTHVKNTAQILMFKIVNEASIASGIRRIEALTGKAIESYIEEQNHKIKIAEVKTIELLDIKRKLEKEINDLKFKENLGQVSALIDDYSEIQGVRIIKSTIHADNVDELKLFGDELRNKLEHGVGVLAAKVEGKVNIVCVVSDDLIKEKKLSAGKIVGDLAKLVGGGGGGRPHLATAGGKDIASINSMLKKVEEIVANYL